MKKRISITLEEDIIKQLDEKVNGMVTKNRSHAIELLLITALGTNRPRKALILCGGRGTRLRPITYEIPKAIIPIHGKTITEHLFDLLKKHGINDVILSVGYKKEKIKEHFGDGKNYGMNIIYVEENEPLGTAGPLRLSKKYITETFIVSNGDELIDINIINMYEFHKKKKALATIALTTVKEPSAYGVVRLDETKIVEFIEKPKQNAPSNLINAGFYIFEPDIIKMIPRGFCMLERDIFPKLAKKGELYGFPFSGQWFDTGNIERYERAIKEWKGIR